MNASGRGHPKDALAALERAMKLLEGHDKDLSPAELADTRFALARALWDSGGDRAQARQHAKWPREIWAKGGPIKAELAAVDAWLHSY